MEKIVEINCLEHIYPDRTRLEICGIELFVGRGERVAVLGPSGSGKTTLLKHIVGLLTPSNGLVKVFGVDPAKEYKKIRQKIGVILQNVEEQLIGPTVLEDVMFSPLNYGYSKEQAEQMAEKVLSELEITHLKHKIIHYLSGGEKRKVALAGALVMKPELLVLDEPFAGLDIKTEKTYIKLIKDYSQENNISVIVSLHNVELVSEFADTVYLISSRDNAIKKGTPAEIFSQPAELQKFNLEEPVMVKLFNRLKQSGLDVKIPVNVDEATQIIQNLCH
ncbi:MAG: hypothetical protein A2Y25_09250 [Candidatus Melainabacteria bacterium GWF2_37_15]|nr:MAG: hypothetical protein A2Y25_09250 [Candidatus Melainabacteria bacterium GWF2_37_15]